MIQRTVFALFQANLIYALSPAVVRAPAAIPTGVKWQFEIQDPLLVPANTSDPLEPEDAQVWDIDLWHAFKNPEIVERLHDRQKTVICYFNFGAVQPEDCDFDQWLSQGLWNGTWYGDVEGNDPYCERYVDLRDPRVLELLRGRLRSAADAGCDGVDPDNIDVYTVDDRISQELNAQVIRDMAAYAKSSEVSRQMLFGQKNAQDMVPDLVGALDFAVLENCIREDFCSEFSPYVNSNPPKPVVDIEYPVSLESPTSPWGCHLSGIDTADRGRFCNNQANGVPAGFSEVLKLDFDDYGLNNCTQYCDSLVLISPAKTAEPGVDSCEHQFSQCSTNPPDPTYCRNRCCEDREECENTSLKFFRF
ncbi:hypothetical protein DL766_009089 [Monosporascus sp. MC13-8B]|uniref:alpha-galactosidase n=1 Tax=Monosporascus cannonballus TaxID=155416 RepID=A0ABY0GV15_9PEZI|nr:hypothetical protein DL762_008839 [Monosporascus cannonballus]RYP16564.1 hypothetical protein DL766_009089 [Monosporascus sp. MC13-8B]